MSIRMVSSTLQSYKIAGLVDKSSYYSMRSSDDIGNYAPQYRSFGLSLRDPKSSHSLSTSANSGRGERQWDIQTMIARD